LIPSTFQTIAHLYLMQSDFNTLPAGYHFFPFLIITLSAIFPLTIYEGGILAAFVAALYIGTAKYLGVLDLTETLNDIWLLMLLGLIAGWAALTQLTMLMRLYRQAHRDSLTGLANRRSITAYLKREVSYSHATKTPLSILLFDLDKFKRVNDSYGHAAGDEVLKVFSQLMIGQSRNEDLVGRYGGEEFLMILSNTNIEIAQKIGERLRLSCHDQQIESPSGEDLFNFTTSIGVAELTANESVTLLLKRVDDALYEAKGAGRDRVVVA
jgi:diguanylate cyclase (GGDEF)-like protein